MKSIQYIITLTLACMFWGCREADVIPDSRLIETSDHITVEVTANMPDFQMARTRSMSESPDYENLNLYVVEFELHKDGTKPNMFVQMCKVSDETQKNDNINETSDYHFNLELEKTEEPRVLHFIACESELSIQTPGTESSIISNLTVNDGTAAYWNRVEFENGYGTFDDDGFWTTSDEVYDAVNNQTGPKLTHIPMICNFSKISVSAATSANFTLLGYELFNQPRSGYVAPYTNGAFPDLLNGNEMKDYNTVNEIYEGRTPGYAVNPNPTEIIGNGINPPVYLYERPAATFNNPYIIIMGRRAGDESIYYYKLDLGYVGSESPFNYYNILRNFHYAITLNSVEADGYKSLEDAINGVVFNNVSFDVTTKNMINISNGTDLLRVNQTSFVVTNSAETEITFRYRYVENFKSTNDYNGENNKNNDIEFIGLRVDVDEDGAIESYNIDEENDEDGWRTITIITPNPSNDQRRSEFILFNPTTGLGRTITILVRNPWNYNDAAVWGGQYNTEEDFEGNEEWKGYVQASDSPGQNLTVRFRISNELPESLFPITFTYEANPQVIENDKEGNLNVVTGTSFFNSAENPINGPRIKYRKTITWTDYNTLLSDSPTGTLVENADGTKINIVRARFLTIDPITAGETYAIRVYSPSFRLTGSPSEYLELTFEGKE